ncbi:MAG: decaprenyl-phosphate phosphoribosyltransferase [Myxococcota bacterium]
MVTAAPARRNRMLSLLLMLRPKDWVKNGLVAAPLLFGARLFDPAAIGSTCLAMVALSLAASAGYVLNDLHDLEGDRVHPVKRHRPLAAGEVDRGVAWLVAAALLVASLLIGLQLGREFTALLVGYLVLQGLYTRWIKHLVILDVLALGSFYVLRVLAGALAVEVPASDWLLLATGLLAVFMGLCKRRHELLLLGDEAGTHRGVLGLYSERFLDPAISLTTSTALITYLLYAMSPETVEKFGSRGMLAGSPFVLYGLLRYLHLVYTKGRGGSPTDVVITDPGVIGAAVGFAIVCGLVVYL